MDLAFPCSSISATATPPAREARLFFFLFPPVGDGSDFGDIECSDFGDIECSCIVEGSVRGGGGKTLELEDDGAVSLGTIKGGSGGEDSALPSILVPLLLALTWPLSLSEPHISHLSPPLFLCDDKALVVIVIMMIVAIYLISALRTRP